MSRTWHDSKLLSSAYFSVSSSRSLCYSSPLNNFILFTPKERIDGRDGRDGINVGNGMKVKILKRNKVFSAITKSMINYFWEQRWISQRRTFKNTQVPCNPRFHLPLKNPLV